MVRPRLITVVILACALVAAIVFGAAAVLGWVLARPIGIVAGVAALTNIGLISAPTSPTGRRIALVSGASVLVAAVAVGAWGFIADAPWWLALMPIAGAILMIPEVLDLVAQVRPGQIKRDETPAVAEDPKPAHALPPLEISMDEDHAFFAGRPRPRRASAESAADPYSAPSPVSATSSVSASSAGSASLPTPVSPASADTPASPASPGDVPDTDRDVPDADRDESAAPDAAPAPDEVIVAGAVSTTAASGENVPDQLMASPAEPIEVADDAQAPQGRGVDDPGAHDSVPAGSTPDQEPSLDEMLGLSPEDPAEETSLDSLLAVPEHDDAPAARGKRSLDPVDWDDDDDDDDDWDDEPLPRGRRAL